MQFECGVHLKQTDPDLLATSSSWSRLRSENGQNASNRLNNRPQGLRTNHRITRGAHPVAVAVPESLVRNGRTNEQTENVLFWGVNKFLSITDADVGLGTKWGGKSELGWGDWRARALQDVTGNIELLTIVN